MKDKNRLILRWAILLGVPATVFTVYILYAAQLPLYSLPYGDCDYTSRDPLGRNAFQTYKVAVSDREALVKKLQGDGFWKFEHGNDESEDSYHFESKKWPFEFYYVTGVPREPDEDGFLEVSVGIFRR